MKDSQARLFDLTPGQLEDLEVWYRDLHGITECDSMKTIISDAHQWDMTIGNWKRNEIAIASGVALTNRTNH